jgi:hypothetical protein
MTKFWTAFIGMNISGSYLITLTWYAFRDNPKIGYLVYPIMILVLADISTLFTLYLEWKDLKKVKK